MLRVQTPGVFFSEQFTKYLENFPCPEMKMPPPCGIMSTKAMSRAKSGENKSSACRCIYSQ